MVDDDIFPIGSRWRDHPRLSYGKGWGPRWWEVVPHPQDKGRKGFAFQGDLNNVGTTIDNDRADHMVPMLDIYATVFIDGEVFEEFSRIPLKV